MVGAGARRPRRSDAANSASRLPRRAVDQIQVDVLEAGRPGPADDLAARGPGCACGPGRAAPRGDVDCMPSDSRVKPAARSASSSAGSVDSGLASVVTSASGGEPEPLADRVEQPGERPAPSSDGVPPPTKTVSTRRGRRRCGAASARPGRSRRRRRPARTTATRCRPSSSGGVGVEVAVPAAGRAERDVQVERQRAVGHPGVRLAGSEPSAGTGSPSGRVDGTRPVCRAGHPDGPAPVRCGGRRPGRTEPCPSSSAAPSPAASRPSLWTRRPTGTRCPRARAGRAARRARRGGRRPGGPGRRCWRTPGPVFSSGMDLKEEATAAPGQEGVRELPAILQRIARSSEAGGRAGRRARPGPAGIGLMAAADIVVAADTATFAFTEVRVGLVPAVISRARAAADAARAPRGGCC